MKFSRRFAQIGFYSNCLLARLCNQKSCDVSDCRSVLMASSHAKEDILILDSTSAVKFSVHLIFPGVVFANNQAAGDWIRDFYARLAPADRAAFTVLKNSGGGDHIKSADDQASSSPATCSLIDFGVYTRNRNFRLYLSTKFGKTTRLELAETDLFSVRLLEQDSGGGGGQLELRRRIFLASLLTWVETAETPLDWPPSSSSLAGRSGHEIAF
jgi:hypothetical protein